LQPFASDSVSRQCAEAAGATGRAQSPATPRHKDFHCRHALPLCLLHKGVGTLLQTHQIEKKRLDFKFLKAIITHSHTQQLTIRE
jgi:hypothetical protein